MKRIRDITEEDENGRAQVAKRISELLRATEALDRVEKLGSDGLTRDEWASLRSANASTKRVFDLLRKRQASGRSA